jgi:hypothetical protein
MRVTVFGFLFLVFASLTQAQVVSMAESEGRISVTCPRSLRDDDKYYLGNVRSALSLAKMGISVSVADRAFQNIGDGASVAVLKIVDSNDLQNPQFVKAYLEVARTAFSRPELTMCAEDKRPEVTLFLLNYLREKVNDEDLQRQIDFAKQYVLNQTKPDAASSSEPPKQSPAPVQVPSP